LKKAPHGPCKSGEGREERSDDGHFRQANGVAIPDCKTLWTIHVQGRVVEVERHEQHFTGFKKYTRGTIGLMSQQSRMRLLRLINRKNLEKFKHNSFITLTYPDTTEFRKYKDRARHRYLFMRAIERDHGRHIATLWRQEFEPRKSGPRQGELMPHYHIMAFDCPFVPAARIRELWAGILDHSGFLATDVKSVRGASSAARYLAKYVSKRCSLDISTYRNNGIQFGRHWGITRTSLIPMHPIRVKAEISTKQAEALKQWQELRLKEGQPPTSGGFTAFGQDVGDIAIALLGIDDPGSTQ